MKLHQLINKDKETQEDFLARTYWGVGKRDMWGNGTEVWVYSSPKHIHNPESTIIETMSMDEARRYLEQLEPKEIPEAE